MKKKDINRLGDRLRTSVSEDDIKALNIFKKSYDDAFSKVREVLKKLEVFEFEYSERNVKTNTSIIAKLQRLPKMKLSRMQDIKGCRIVVRNMVVQKGIKNTIEGEKSWERIKVQSKDNAVGYRAIHIIVHMDDKPIEIQLRTQLQHHWANLCEKLSASDNDLKYGKSKDTELQKSLKKLSDIFKTIDSVHQQISKYSLNTKY